MQQNLAPQNPPPLSNPNPKTLRMILHRSKSPDTMSGCEHNRFLHRRSPTVFIRVRVVISTIVSSFRSGIKKVTSPPTPLPPRRRQPLPFPSRIKPSAEDEGTMLLNIAMKMHFTKHSDSPICPGYGKEVL